MAKKPEPVEKVLPAELHAEIDGLLKLSQKALERETDDNEELSITIKEGKLGDAVNGLTLVRALVRDTKKVADATRDESIPADLAKRLKAIDAERKSISKRAEEVEHDFETALYAAVALGQLTDEGYVSPAGCKIVLTSKVDVVRADVAYLPDEYLLPREQCIDWGKVKDALLADQRKREAAAELGLPIPAFTINPAAASLGKSISFRTTQPEVVE